MMRRENVTGEKAAGWANGWLVFFYSVPSRPVSCRMKIWRRLVKAGAVPLKGAVYVLPFSDEHYELLQWLVSEIAGMKGEGAFARIDRVETMTDAEIIALFNRQRLDDYRPVGKNLDDIESRLSSIQKGAAPRNIKAIHAQLSKLGKDFEGIRAVDFFGSAEGAALGQRLADAGSRLDRLAGIDAPAEKPETVAPRSAADYQGRTWTTRTNPFIDRMASAWLIRKFIDKSAVFHFADDQNAETAARNSITFDMRNGDFTHVGDRCTFEVLVESFAIKDRALKQMAEIVHDLDMKDGKFGASEAAGLENILAGIRKTAKDDSDALEKGIAVFEMLYVSKS